MNEAIQHRVIFKDATAAELFSIITDPKKHSAILGGTTARISDREGEPFSLMDGNLQGKNLLIVPNKMIVQSWRGNIWKPGDLDSILIFVFSDTKKGAQVDLVHAVTPDHFTELWDKIYWQPIREYLAAKK